MASQPVPDVNEKDVLRVVRRDFPSHGEDTILSILRRYGGHDLERESARVHLAILKLSGGQLEALETYAEIACLDYRDVLGPAEYPKAMERGVRPYKRGEKKATYAEDWEQYEQWLMRR